MNSQERHLARYKRRKGERLQKQIKDSEIYSYDYAISPIAIKNAYEECRSGTSWKSSVQQYGANEWRNAIEYSKRIKENKYNPKKTKCFIINERGKLRHIAAVDIADRVIQKSLCENVLCPIISKTLIYDNGASQDNKGTSFTSNRLVYHLHKFYNENKGIAAICAAPRILGELGFLKEKKACCYPGNEAKLLGAIVTEREVEVSENIITSRGAGTAIAFALAMITFLIGKDTAEELGEKIIYQK